MMADRCSVHGTIGDVVYQCDRPHGHEGGHQSNGYAIEFVSGVPLSGSEVTSFKQWWDSFPDANNECVSNFKYLYELCWKASQARTLPCGHPAACQRADGTCGWCAAIRERDDLAMLFRRAWRRVKSDGDIIEMLAKAMEYINRKKLNGSPFRAQEPKP